MSSDTIEDELPRIEGVLPKRLVLCFSCGYHVYPHESECPHCGADYLALIRQHDDAVRLALDAIERLKIAFGVTDE
jgi:hypothetical protein